MNFSTKVMLCLLAIILLSIPVSTTAQSITVLGGSADAKECYMSAQIAIQLRSASRAEIKTCTNALTFERLTIRDKAATFVNRGVLHVAMEEYQLAIKDYANAMKHYPEFGAIYVNRGNLFFLGESYDSAISEYTRALELDVRQDYVAHLNRGMAYEKLGKLSEAESDYRLAVELAPEWTLAKTKLERVLGKIN